MSLSTHLLGTTVHVHPERSIQLSVASTALISCPDNSNPPLDSSKLFHEARAGKVWVSLDAYLQFRLSIKVYGTLHAPQNSEVIFSDIAEKVGKAKFWADLHLAVTSQTYEVESHRADLVQLSVIVRVQLNAPQPSSRKPVKIPSALDALFNNGGNIQPPLGISVAHLREVHISLDLTSTSPVVQPIGKRVPRKMVARDDIYLAPAEEDPWFHEFYSNGDQNFILSKEHNPKSRFVNMAYPVPGFDMAWESLDEDSPFSSQESRESSTSICAPGDPGTLEMDHSIYISLLDSGLRNVFFSSHRLWNQHGIKVSTDANKTSLMDIAPTIFDPGYRTTVAQRSQLIPTIAKGISLLVSHSVSPASKSKLQVLEASFRGTHSNSLNENIDIKSMVQCLLWRRMQRGLDRPKAACNLTPLDTDTPFAQPDTLFASTENESEDPTMDLFGPDNETDDFGYDSDDSGILTDDPTACDSNGYDFNSIVGRLPDTLTEPSLVDSELEILSRDISTLPVHPTPSPHTLFLSPTLDAHGAEELSADDIFGEEAEMLCSSPAGDTEMLF